MYSLLVVSLSRCRHVDIGVYAAGLLVSLSVTSVHWQMILLMIFRLR